MRAHTEAPTVAASFPYLSAMMNYAATHLREDHIYARPTCAYLRTDYQGTDRERSTWWAGVPGNWMRLPANGWVVTHWTPLPTWRDGHWMTRGSCLGTEVPRV